MVSESLLNHLFSRWEDLCRQGQAISAEELCEEFGYGDAPELVAELERRIRDVATVGPELTQLTGRADEATTIQMGGDSTNGVDGVPVPTGDEVIFSVGQYDYFHFLAKGGVGEVYRAGDKDFGREVALKFIQSEQVSHPESMSQFLLEGEVTARLEHPGVVPVYGLGCTSDGRPFHVMRLIRGETLGDRIHQYYSDLARGLKASDASVRFRELLNRFVSVCNTAAYAHNRGILHRDLKPDNIMLGKYGETLVVDWGLARPIERSAAARATGEQTLKPGSGDLEEENLFAKGVVGTPAYMSPEQARGESNLTPATDIYSLGAVLYKLITGESAIEGTHVRHMLSKAKQGKFPKPRDVNKRAPGALQAICLKAMSREPEQRYETALDLATDVERWLADERVAAYRESWPQRLARWARRHRTAVQMLLLCLVLLIAAATASAIWLANMARRERDAHRREMEKTEQLQLQSDELQQLAESERSARAAAMRTTAYAVAQNIQYNLESRRSVLERLVRDADMRRLLAEWNQIEHGDDEAAKTAIQEQLGNWLNQEFDSEEFGHASNWFINDDDGTQIARASTDKGEEGQLSVGKNFAWRSYFHGGPRDLIEKRNAADGDIEPLRHGPHLGAVYLADPYRVHKVPISMPIRSLDKQEVMGVLGIAVDLGDFDELQMFHVLLVDLRTDYLEGAANSGLILHHRRLGDRLQSEETGQTSPGLPRLSDGVVLGRVNGNDPQAAAALDAHRTGLLEAFDDPLTDEPEQETVAYRAIRLGLRWPQQLPGPCWCVVVLGQ